MFKYDPKSLVADEFINHEEILETLKYADENKDNLALIGEILDKARPQYTDHGTFCRGLSHREASVLLACEDPDIIEKTYELSREIKQAFYGNRIVMFAPLYLSNYCVNGCVYCPYHAKNKHICRKKLTQEEVKAEVIALQDMGHKRLAIEAGEDPVHNPIEYILECIDTIYSIKHTNGAIRRVNVNIAATTALGTIDPRGRELGILHGANVVMPNLSPAAHRKDYSLYDNKNCTGEEAAECLNCLKGRMRSIGYEIVKSRGDYAGV